MNFDENFSLSTSITEGHSFGNYNTGMNKINLNYKGKFEEECLNFSITNKINNKRKHDDMNSKNIFDEILDNDSNDFFKFIVGNDDENTNRDIDNDNNDDMLCNNPLCDHKDYKKNEQRTDHKKTKPVVINDVTDMIKLGKTYHCKKNKEYYGINLRILCNLVPPLTELNQLIGMESVKTNIVNQIVFFLQGFNKNDKCGDCVDCCYNLPCARNLSNDMLHTVITGPPGVGKTELGKILGKVYKAMGVLSKGTMKVVSRSDLIGKYLGHTAAKTQNAINDCIGGVMFIDEAYALGNNEGRDSFSKECIDTLNQNLTEKRDFLCIIAGYKDALDNCFFNYNEGLKRRFTFRYDIKKYSHIELKQIFNIKIKKEGWTTEYELCDKDDAEITMNKHTMEQKLNEFFERNMENFPNFGGDIETLFLNCKISHSKRVLFLSKHDKKKLTLDDIQSGFEVYLKNRQYKEDEEAKKYNNSKYMIY